MTYPVTITSLLSRVRQRANLEGATAFLPDNELQGLINESIAEWYDLVRLTTWGGQYYRSAYSFTTVGGTSSYALPSDFLALVSLDIALSSSQVLSASPYQEEMRNAYRFYPLGWVYGRPVMYQLQGPSVNLIPAPQAGYTCTLNYVPTAPKLSGDGDTLDSINGWDSWIVLDAAIKALTKDGQLDIIGLLSQERAAQRERILSAAGNRDMVGEVTHDRAGSYDDWYGGY